MGIITKISATEVQDVTSTTVTTTYKKKEIREQLQGLRDRRDTDLAYWNGLIAEKKAILDKINELNLVEE